MTSLKEYRKEKKMLQRDVANKAAISTPYYSLIESGHRLPSFKNARSLAHALEISLDELYKLLFKEEGEI